MATTNNSLEKALRVISTLASVGIQRENILPDLTPLSHQYQHRPQVQFNQQPCFFRS